MEKVKRVSDISFLTDDQKLWFEHYTISNSGAVFNEKTDKETVKTIHGQRGYVVNLSVIINKKRKQRMIVVARAMADLFIRPIKDDEKIFYVDNDMTNINIDNIVYRMTKTAKNKEYCECSKVFKGISDDGRFCTICEKFIKWDDICTSTDGKRLSTCKKCSSKRSYEYQKSTGFPKNPVPFKTYKKRLSGDNPINVDEKLGIKCPKCGDIFLPIRSRVLGRVNLIEANGAPRPFICEKCK